MTTRTSDPTSAAIEHGIADLGSYVLLGLAAGRSLTALSTAAGLPQGWLNEHLDQVIDSAAWQHRLTGTPTGCHAESRPAMRLVWSAGQTR